MKLLCGTLCYKNITQRPTVKHRGKQRKVNCDALPNAQDRHLTD